MRVRFIPPEKMTIAGRQLVATYDMQRDTLFMADSLSRAQVAGAAFLAGVAAAQCRRAGLTTIVAIAASEIRNVRVGR